MFAFNYCNKILKITFCISKRMYVYNKTKRELYASDCECFKRPIGCRVLAVKCSKKWPFKLGRMYQTAHQNDRFHALRLCCSKLNPACMCYDSTPAKHHKARWAIQLLNHLLGLVHVTFKSDQAQWHSSWSHTGKFVFRTPEFYATVFG